MYHLVKDKILTTQILIIPKYREVNHRKTRETVKISKEVYKN